MLRTSYSTTHQDSEFFENKIKPAASSVVMMTTTVHLCLYMFFMYSETDKNLPICVICSFLGMHRMVTMLQSLCNYKILGMSKTDLQV